MGQGHVIPILKAIVSSGNVPPALLFSGTRGTGKTTCARLFAAALNCESPEGGDSCGKCAQCSEVRSAKDTSVLEIDAASNGGVDEVRRIRELCQYTHSANWRVVILDEAQSMSDKAYNALLKLMEEPPANTVFLLVTTEPEKILGTVQSRAMPFEFRRIRLTDIASRLQAVAKDAGIAGDEGLFFELAQAAQGGLRDALMLLDQVSRVGIATAEEFRDFFGERNYSVPLLWAAVRGDHATGYALVADHFSRTGEAHRMVSDLSQAVTSLLILKSGGVLRDLPEDAMVERVELASTVSSEALVRVSEILWELKSRTRLNDSDQRGSMEMAFALIANFLQPFQDQPESEETSRTILGEEPVAEPLLTLAEMHDFLGE